MFTKILHRPAFAIVISIILLFLGVLGIKTLPIAQFPNIAPPTVMVSISYPGASANVLVESVLIPLEQSINGVQNMRFITSSATSAGEAAIIIYFEPGTDPNINVVNVQNRVNIVLFQLPPLVRARGDPRQPGRAEHADVREHLQHGSQRRPERPLQLRQRLRHAPAQADQRHGHPQESRQPHLRDAGLAESRPHARLQRVLRGCHEGSVGTEHDWFARTTRPGHREDVAIKRVRVDLYRALQQARAVCKHHFKSKSRWGDPAAQGRWRRWSWVPSSSIFTRTSTGIPRRPSSSSRLPAPTPPR